MDTRSVVAAENLDQGEWVVVTGNLVFRAREGQDTTGQALHDTAKNEVCTIVLSQPWPYQGRYDPPAKIGLTGEFQQLGIVIKQHNDIYIAVENAPQHTAIMKVGNQAAVYVGIPLPAKPETIIEYVDSKDLAVKYWYWQTTSYPVIYSNPTVQMMQRAFQDYNQQKQRGA